MGIGQEVQTDIVEQIEIDSKHLHLWVTGSLEHLKLNQSATFIKGALHLSFCRIFPTLKTDVYLTQNYNCERIFK